MPDYMIRKIAVVVMICISAIWMSCSSRSLTQGDAMSEITVDKQPLRMHNDSVRFKLRATIPAGTITEERFYLILPEFQYGEGALPLEEIKITHEDLSAPGQTAQVIRTLSFPYLEGMDRGELQVKGLLQESTSGNSVSTPNISLAKGIVSTPELTRVGQFAVGENIPDVGAYMSYEEDFLNLAARELSYYFAKNSSYAQGSSKNARLEDELNQIIAKGQKIQQVSISGMCSPDEEDFATLSNDRAHQVEVWLVNYLSENGYKGDPNAVNIKIVDPKQDWLLFRHLLRTFENIDMKERDKYFDIIYSEDSYEGKINRMKLLPSYTILSREKFADMQMARVTVMLEQDRSSDPEISGLAHSYINGTAKGDELTEAELARAAELNPGLKERQILYEAMLSLHGSALAYNNLGVVYLNQAHRMNRISDKNQKVNEAMRMFRMSYEINESAYARHNMGQAYLMWGDYDAAYLEISEANSLSKDQALLNAINEGKRGALDILRGDYKLATLRLSKAPATEVNLFNKGLAFYLAEEYAEAAIAFEQSALANMNYGYAFYGLALVAANNHDEERLFENLKKAINRSPYLKNRAATDLEFRDYFKDPAFIEAIL